MQGQPQPHYGVCGPAHTAAQMLAAQSRRWQSVDSLLPACVTPTDGTGVIADTADGKVAGVVLHYTHPPGSVARTWSAADVSELVPLLGAGGPAAMHALLTAWRNLLPQLDLPATDSSCLVSWPSRDVEVSSALLDHGLVPLSVIAVRTTASAPASDPPGLLIRRATPADLPDCLRLAMLEQAYSAMVGGAVHRAGATELKRSLLIARLSGNDPIWLAEQAGIVVGLLECGYTNAAPGTWAATRLPAGRWGYVNCASVLPGARGLGVGRALVERAHAAFAAAETTGSYLYYNPPNPLSTVFWHRRGYRPLWTQWETRPATALR